MQLIRRKDSNQLSLFGTVFEQTLDLENHWVKFSNIYETGLSFGSPL